jgi:hypothetical protein
MTGQEPLPVADVVPALVFGFGIPGLKGILLIALVALALYGRPGSRLLAATPYGRALRPWLSLVRVPMPSKPAAARAKGRGRLFWALALTLAAALAALIANRIAVQIGAGMPR